jgi:hypothetical protein
MAKAPLIFTYYDHSPASAGATSDRPDPAYRYAGTTFRFNDKHPWQDGRSFDRSDRPYLIQMLLRSIASRSPCYRDYSRFLQARKAKLRFKKLVSRRPSKAR